MHRPLSISTSLKKTPSWKLIAVISGVVIFILFISYYQLNRTLQAMRVHNHDLDGHHSSKNEVKSNDDEHNDDHKAALALLGDVVDVKNGNPDLVNHNREQSNNKKISSLSESDIRNVMMMNSNSKNGNDAVKSICSRLVESLEKFDVATSRESDLFLTTASKPISELIPTSSVGNHDDSHQEELDSKISKLDVELFVIWYDAISKTHKILNDMRKKFFIIGIEYVDWNQDRVSQHEFESNLWRLYSGKGGWERVGMAKKVKQCGYGPFIIVAVVDPNPSYKVEHTAHGDDTVNHNMNAAKKLYRGWAGGGFKVHGTFGPVEAEHDIALLFHRSKYDFGYVFKHLLELQRHDDKKQNAKFVLLVDEFVKNLRSVIFNSGGFKSSSKKNNIGEGNGEIVSFNFRFDHPLSISTINREVSSRFAGESACRVVNHHHHQQQKNESSSSSLLLLQGDTLKPDPAIATKYRDFVFSNEYVTARRTLGMHGFYACRDLLLALKTFIDARQIQDVEGFSQESDQQVNLKDLECLRCAKWPSELKIKLSGASGESARWAISSLVATSAEEPIYAAGGDKMKRPNGFKDVPFFVFGSGKKAKKITFSIV